MILMVYLKKHYQEIQLDSNFKNNIMLFLCNLKYDNGGYGRDHE